MRTFLQNLNQINPTNGFTALKSPANNIKKVSKQYAAGSIDHHFNEVPLHPHSRLSVNQPNDRHEQEADAVADSVMNMTGSEHTATNGPGSLLNGSGKQMDNGTMSFMQDRFGFNFGNIAIHTNEEAANRSRELNARAFTAGNNIYFNEGEYDPASAKGKHLLAHELMHTIQQSVNGPAIQKDDKDKPEKKAEVSVHWLPPEVKARIYHLLFEANTSEVKLDYETERLKTSLAYKYGSDLTLELKGGKTSGSIGFTPGENQLTLGLERGPFRAGVSATPGQQKYGLSLGVGAKLAPSLYDMNSTFATGGTSAGNLITGAPGAFNNPLAYYKDHKQDIDNVKKAADMVKDITEVGKRKISFGADFSLSYDPQKHFVYTIRAGVLYSF